jgi:hypothetical protein
MRAAVTAVVISFCGSASATTLRVPQDYATIQAAVDAAQPGDRVHVAPGSWCGATVNKKVKLEGHPLATIVGCAAPTLDGGPLRVGFYLGSGASGSEISHFVFDGSGVSNQNTVPLAFGVFARGADDVVVEHDLVLGTAQAITNSSGSGWQVDWNAILDLTAFTCDGFCGGGDGIVFQQRTAGAPRAVGNSAEHNFVSGKIPDHLDEFGLAGVLIYGQDGATASHNELAIPANSNAKGDGVGVLVSDVCCGEPTAFDTSIDSVIVGNDGRESQVAVRVTRDASGGTGNSQGAYIAHNHGVLDINGVVTVALKLVLPLRKPHQFQ